MRTLIIKPCTEDAQVITLRTTQIEWVLYPFMYEQTRDAKAISTMMGHAFHDIIQSCSHNEWGRDSAYKAAMMMNNIHLKNWTAMLWMYKNSIDDKIRFFVNNLEKGTIVNYWLDLYTKKMATEVSMGIWVECWEYRVWLTGTCDILEEDWMYDPKYYSKLREREALKELYTKDNYMYSSLSEKLQWYFYPYLWYGVTEEPQYFTYDVFDKTKKMKHERLRCELDMNWAEQQVKRDIISYFRTMKANGTHLV